MIPLRLEISGFMTYREPVKFDFTDAKLWMLEGPNGSGKSSVFDAITFALFGTYRSNNYQNGRQQDVAFLINQHPDTKGFKIGFEFILKGQEYRIERSAEWKLDRKGHSKRSDAPEKKAAVYLLPENSMLCEKDKEVNTWVLHNLGLTYEAFTSSLLLLQGKSEKLLNATPAERWKILKSFVDLSQYEKLEQAALSAGSEFKTTVANIEKELTTFQGISENSIKVAEVAESKARESVEAIQAKIAELNVLHYRAGEWEKGTKELTEIQTELDNLEVLFTNRSEIEKANARLEEIEKILPDLEAMLNHQNDSTAFKDKLQGLEVNLKELAAQVAEAELTSSHINQTLDDLRHQEKKLQDEKDIINSKIIDLATLANNWENYFGLETKLASIEQQLENLPPNLAAQLEETTKRTNYLLELKQAMPILEDINDRRNNLISSSREYEAYKQQAEQIGNELNESKEAKTRLMVQLDNLKAVERKVFAQAESEKKALNNIEATIKNFQELPTGQKCQQCGQLISPEHKETELAFLQANLEVQRGKWNELEQEALRCKRQLDEKQKLLKEQEVKVEKLESANQTAITNQNNFNTAIMSHFQVLKSYYSQVPPRYREKIALNEPQQPKDWLNIVYPDINELNKFRDELSKLDSVQRNLKDLERAVIDSEKLHLDQQDLRSQVAVMKSKINVEEAQSADQQLKQFKAKLNEVVEGLKSLEKEIADNSSKLAKSTEACKKLKDTRESKEREKSRLEGSLEETIKHISRAQQKVDKAYWAFTSSQLEKLKLEQKSLGEYKGQKDALDEALKNHKSLQEKLKNIQEAINQLPAAACRPQRAVQDELETSINRKKIADGELDKTIGELGIIRNKWQVRQEKEEELKKNRKSVYLYSSLAILLGQKKGLQGYIFQLAEKVILAYANETLSNLSNGQLLLQIKPTEEEDSQIAFDLMVYNYAVGTMPMPINMVSGSQKFRIAVSLALAIGRFSSQDNRLIEAVIIDEGFGSLDKNNLNEMIQEINKLERILKKVILVSHQDEFAHAFSNRYKITLEDKTSHVERVIENFSAE